MAWRPAISVGLAAALAVCLAAPALAQDIARPAGTQRSFAVPLFWLNAGAADRLPISERPLAFQPGSIAPVPPTPVRSGLTPRLSFTMEARDRTGEETGIFAVFSPGLEYRRASRRTEIRARASIDAIADLTDGSRSGLIEGLGADVELIHSLTSRATFEGSLAYGLETGPRDSTLARLQGQDVTFGTLTAEGAWIWATSPRTTWKTGVSLAHLSTDTDGAPHATDASLKLAGRHRIAERLELGAEAGIRYFHFNRDFRDSAVWSLEALAKADLGDRSALSGRFGLLGTDAAGGGTWPTGGARFVQTWRNAELVIGADRTLDAAAGIAGPVRTDAVWAKARLRVAPGVLAEGRAERQWLRVYDGSGAGFRVIAIEGQVSYALKRHFWAWARLRLSEEQGQTGATTRDARLLVGLSRTFRR